MLLGYGACKAPSYGACKALMGRVMGLWGVMGLWRVMGLVMGLCVNGASYGLSELWGV